APREGREQPVPAADHRVLLEHDERQAERPRGEPGRDRRAPPGRDDEFGTALAQDAPRFERAVREPVEAREPLAAEIERQGLAAVALEEFAFDRAPLGQEERLVPPGAQRFAEDHRGPQVAPGAARDETDAADHALTP